MRRQFLLLFLVFCFVSTTHAQTQWAASVVDASSQLNNSAPQLTGAPDAQRSAGTWRGVWTPRAAESFYPESVTVRFSEPQRADHVTVVECDKPGAISRIVAIDERNQAHILYKNDYPRVILKPTRRFVAEFPLTDYRIVQVQISLNTKAVRGYNRLDAIGIGAGVPDTMRERIPTQGAGALRDLGADASPFNTDYHEHAPVLSADGRTLYFARRYHPQNVGTEDRDDIYVSRRLPSGRWSRAITVGPPVNGLQHDRPVGCSTDGDRLYLLREHSDGSRELLASQRSGRAYTTPQRLLLPGGVDLAAADAFVTADGRLFAMTTAHELLEVTPDGRVGARRRLPQSVVTLRYVAENGQTVYATDAQGAVSVLELENNYWVTDRTASLSAGARGGFTLALGPQEVFTADGAADHYNLTAHLLTETLRPRAGRTSEFTARGGAVATDVRATAAAAAPVQRTGYFIELAERHPELATAQLDRAQPDSRATESVRDLELRVQRLETELAALQRQRTDYVLQPGFTERVLRPVVNGYDYDRERLRREYDAAQRGGHLNPSPDRPLTEAEKVAQLREKFNRANRREVTAAPDFAHYERELVQLLRAELQPRLTDELYRQLVDEVKAQVQLELSQTEQPHLYDAGVRLVRQHSTSAAAAERPVITEDVSERIEASLRRALEPAVRSELRRQLEPQIREQLRRELIYEVKRRVRDDLSGSADKNFVDQPVFAAAPPDGAARTEDRYVALHAGSTVRLNNLYFYANEADLLPASDPELDRVATLLTDHPRLTVEIAVHTHGQLDPARAKTLTDARARNVRDGLLARGITPARVIALGYGSREPLGDNTTDAGRRTNQRTELRVL